MKRLLLSLVLSTLLLFSTAPLVSAAQIEDASGFEVSEILRVEEANNSLGNSESVTETLIEEGREEGTSAIGALILRAINVLTLLIGTFAFVMFVIGGIMMITANGEESKIDRAKAVINQTIFGMLIAFSSYFVVALLLSFLYS